MQCIPRHLQLTLIESALCCPCLEPLFSLGSQTACTQCTFSTLPGVLVPGTGSQPSYTASSEQAPIHFTAENSISGTMINCIRNTNREISALFEHCTLFTLRNGLEAGGPRGYGGDPAVRQGAVDEKGPAARGGDDFFRHRAAVPPPRPASPHDGAGRVHTRHVS